MLKSLFGSMRSAQAGRNQDATAPRKIADAGALKVLIDYFALGKKLRYIPEFKNEIVFDTIVVGYGVNEHFVYSRDSIEFDGEGNPLRFLIGEARDELPVAKVRRFFLLVPDTSDQEQTLDYHRRAMLGRGQFTKGNAITLIASASGRGQVTLDTEVAKPVTLKDGPYANEPMVLLIPEVDTLDFVDNRKKSRSPTRVPVALYPGNEGPAHVCLLVDFSETTVQLRSEDGQGAMPTMPSNGEVIIVVDLGSTAKTYTIKGLVLRSAPDSCVLRLEELHKNNRFVRFSVMDSLELKSGLLNYGA